jgi:hypothetical protein
MFERLLDWYDRHLASRIGTPATATPTH